MARRCAAEDVDHLGFLLQLCELELIERERRAAQRRLKAARFPTVKTLEAFDFVAAPALNKPLVLEPAHWPVLLGEADGEPSKLLRPAADDVLRAWPISTTVNSVRHNGPELLRPTRQDAEGGGANPA